MSKEIDRKLRQDVVDQLEWEPSIDARKIGVAVDNGIITLTGHVPTYVEKTAAEKAIKHLQGVLAVANDIEVKLPMEAERDDSDIARAAVNALEWNAAVPKDKIEVVVTKGWVTLEGQVEWYYQKREAEEAVRVLSGVRGVTNKIAVAARKIDAAGVKAKIEAALKRNAEIDAQKIVVETGDGQVTLRGNVRSWIEREDAVNAAWSAPGVTKVVDRITIHA
jgi:osmotically-inducible protein OsmY